MTKALLLRGDPTVENLRPAVSKWLSDRSKTLGSLEMTYDLNGSEKRLLPCTLACEACVCLLVGIIPVTSQGDIPLNLLVYLHRGHSNHIRELCFTWQLGTRVLFKGQLDANGLPTSFTENKDTLIAFANISSELRP